MTEHVEISRDGAIQTLRLSRPDKKNALTRAMYAALSDALERGDTDNAVAVYVICGSGGSFCAGNDLGDFLASSSAQEASLEPVMRFVRLLPVIKKPLIAAVDGPAVGIGTTLLFHCDLIFASERSTFATPFLDLGLIPEAASSLLMPRMMGYHRAFEMLVLGNVFSAARAYEAGFVNALLPYDDLESAAMKAAQRLAQKPPEALAIARRLVRGEAADILSRANEEAVLFEQRLATPEAREAFRAFFDKRPSDFTKSRS